MVQFRLKRDTACLCRGDSAIRTETTIRLPRRSVKGYHSNRWLEEWRANIRLAPLEREVSVD